MNICILAAASTEMLGPVLNYYFSYDQHLTDGKKKCERNRKREGKFLESVISKCKGDINYFVISRVFCFIFQVIMFHSRTQAVLTSVLKIRNFVIFLHEFLSLANSTGNQNDKI